jgi:3-oxoacyl-[acyl-carrier protein] reductase
MQLKNKIAIITGASRGIGKAIAQTFLKEGAKVVIAARNKQRIATTIQELKKLGEVHGIQADVGKIRDVEKLVEKTEKAYGRIDLLLNVAGILSPIGAFADQNPNKIIKNIQTNLLGTILCCRMVLPIMMNQQSGKIINFSGGGSLYPRPNFIVYGCSKTGIIRFSESLAAEVKNFGIDVNVIAPGAVDTDMVSEILAAGDSAGEAAMQDALKVRQTGGTGLEAPAKLAVYLASSDSDGITGRIISAPWDPWKELRKSDLEKTSLYTLRRIDGKKFFENKNS